MTKSIIRYIDRDRDNREEVVSLRVGDASDRTASWIGLAVHDNVVTVYGAPRKVRQPTGEAVWLYNVRSVPLYSVIDIVTEDAPVPKESIPIS